MKPQTTTHTQHVTPAKAGIHLFMDSLVRGNGNEMSTVTESSV